MANADPAHVNLAVWRRGRFVREYASRRLRPVEVLALIRYRDELTGRVLDLGCGAGRLMGYLVELAEEAWGVDLSPRMLEECRRRYPSGHYVQGDVRDLSRFEDGFMDAVFAPNNLLDIFEDGERRATLREVRRVMRPGGLLVMSSHNRAHLPLVPRPGDVRTSDPLRLAYDLARMPVRLWRHRPLRELERQTTDYAIVSDGSHGYRLVHYYIDADAGRRQLEQEGYEVLAVADLEGHELNAGESAPESSELHYFARRAG